MAAAHLVVDVRVVPGEHDDAQLGILNELNDLARDRLGPLEPVHANHLKSGRLKRRGNHQVEEGVGFFSYR